MIYLDANSSSRLRPEIKEFITEFLTYSNDWPANPSSVHKLGQKARGMLDRARTSILDFLNLSKNNAELIFTSGGTESCNQMILGFLGELSTLAKFPAHIISSSIEHPAVLETLKMLETSGWQVSYIDPERNGIVKAENFISELKPNTALINLMHINNETGAIQDVVGLSKLLRENGYTGPIVSDCIQAIGKIKFSALELFEAGVTAISISAHKLGALTGIGALIVAKNNQSQCFTYHPMIKGGPQEKRFRGGTENLLAACSFAEVAKVLKTNLSVELQNKQECRELLWREINNAIPTAVRITPEIKKANSNTLMIRFSECRGDDLVVSLDLNGIAASTGSACSSGRQEISHVLKNMGLSKDEAREVVRFSLDWDIDKETVLKASRVIADCVRNISGLRETDSAISNLQTAIRN